MNAMGQGVRVGGDSRMRTMWRLSWPAIIEQILATLVGYMDSAMVGVMGAAATAAVSVNAASIWMAGGLLVGVGVGYSVQVSNAVGAGDDERARGIIRQGVLATVVTGLLALVIFQLLAGYIPKWLGAETQVLPQAVAYLRFYTLGMPFVAASNIFSAILRCMGNTRTPLCFNMAANVLNVILNFLLIYPTRQVTVLGAALTMPGAGLGVAGAALASAIALAFSGTCLLVVGMRQGARFRVLFRECFRPEREIIRRAIALGVPTAIERATINMGQIAMTAVVATLGTVALAANHIATTAEAMCYLPAYGISFAGIALVGQSVGAGSREDARAYGNLAGKLGFALTLATAAGLFLGAPYLAALFNSDPAVVEQAALMLRIVSVCEPFFAVSIIFSSTLRGAHDVRVPMVVSLVCMWGVRVVLALVLVYGFRLSLAGVWIAMAVDLTLRGIICTLRWRSGRWAKKCGLA